MVDEFLRFRDMFSTTHFKTLNNITHFSVQDINSERSEFKMLAEITGSLRIELI